MLHCLTTVTSTCFAVAASVAAVCTAGDVVNSKVWLKQLLPPLLSRWGAGVLLQPETSTRHLSSTFKWATRVAFCLTDDTEWHTMPAQPEGLIACNKQQPVADQPVYAVTSAQ